MLVISLCDDFVFRLRIDFLIKKKEKQKNIRLRHHQVQISYSHNIERIIMCAEVYPPRRKKICIADLVILKDPAAKSLFLISSALYSPDSSRS